jgi:hypothetical protein
VKYLSQDFENPKNDVAIVVENVEGSSKVEEIVKEDSWVTWRSSPGKGRSRACCSLGMSCLDAHEDFLAKSRENFAD